MKRVIISFLLGIMLASGTAYASTSWFNRGQTYSCDGGQLSVFCKETNWDTNYSVAIYPGAVSVSFGSRLIYWCNRKKQPQYNCVSYTR